MQLEEIKKYLPHREPMLLVDEVLVLDQDYIQAKKYFSIDSHFFQGHFPGNPILPGVIITEALAQTAAILAYKQFNLDPKTTPCLLAGVDKARFKRQVKPQSTLILEAKLLQQKGKLFKFAINAYIEKSTNKNDSKDKKEEAKEAKEAKEAICSANILAAM